MRKLILQVLHDYRQTPGLAEPAAVCVEDLETQGFSGARLWRVTAGDATYALRRWPLEHPTRSRLVFMHEVLGAVAAHGRPPIAAPIRADDGQTWVEHEGHFWELTSWIVGQPDFRQAPSQAKLEAAMIGLAEFHLATATLWHQTGPSPGLASRLQTIRRAPQVITAWQRANSGFPSARIHALVGDLLGGVILQLETWQTTLTNANQLTWPLQPCIRDIWHAHVFFQEAIVTGFIDFGALGLEHPAADVARLLGSLADQDHQFWHVGLAAYHQRRSLSADDRQLIRLFAQTNRLFAGVAWGDWIYVEKRSFVNWDNVQTRLVELQEGLQGRAVAERTLTGGLVLPADFT